MRCCLEFLLFSLAGSSLACGATRESASRPPPAAEAPTEKLSEGAVQKAPSTEPPSDEPPPAEPLPEFWELEVPGFRPAIVATPRDESRPQPALVAVHGAGDGPQWQCAFWRELLDAKAFVLCPTGVPFGKSPREGYFFRNHYELEKEVLSAVEALRTTLGDRLEPGPLVYAGYSQGATMGALMLVAHGDVFPRLILIEGGYSEWNVSIAKKFAQGGGRRVLFACGIRSCRTKADRSAEWVAQAGVASRVEYAEGAGHTYGGRVADKVHAALDWVFEGDRRWQ